MNCAVHFYEKRNEADRYILTVRVAARRLPPRVTLGMIPIGNRARTDHGCKASADQKLRFELPQSSSDFFFHFHLQL